MKTPRILTTVVGSYPLPDWLAKAPSEQALVDATRVVIATQEQAGIDLVCDGELYRFDPNHPETSGLGAVSAEAVPAGMTRPLAAMALAASRPIIERARMVGGVCLHTGTVPSKTFREAVLSLTHIPSLSRGVPVDRPSLVTTDQFQTAYIAAASAKQVFGKRCLDELGYFPYRGVSRLDLVDDCWVPSVDSLYADARDLLDP